MAGKHLAAMENELNIRLLQRTTRRLTLTPSGEAYYLRCRQILEHVEEANREASAAQTAIRGSLKISAPVTFGATQLGPAIASFMREHAALEVNVVLDDRYVDLLDTGVDLAIRIGKLPDSQLAARRIAPCRMILCAAPDLLRERGMPQTPDDLASLPRLMFSNAVSPGDWTVYTAAGRAHRIDGPCRMSANNMQALLSAAVEGLGIAYGPSFVFSDALASGRLVSLLPGFRCAELPIQAVFPAARHLPLKVSRFVEHLVRCFGDEPPWDRRQE